jgi:ribonuclease HI
LIIYYTDGSTAPKNPGPGGFAVIKDMQPYYLGSEPGETTNIRMEGMAIIAALEDADGAECEIRTDSLFWINVLTDWIVGWRKRQFKAVKNLDLVTEMDFLYRKSQATLTHVRGHKGEPGNELADQWANTARVNALNGGKLGKVIIGG